MDKKYYYIETVEHFGVHDSWHNYVIVELSNPDKDGHWQRSRMFADFGNVINPENLENANKMCSLLNFLEINKEN